MTRINLPNVLPISPVLLDPHLLPEAEEGSPDVSFVGSADEEIVTGKHDDLVVPTMDHACA